MKNIAKDKKKTFNLMVLSFDGNVCSSLKDPLNHWLLEGNPFGGALLYLKYQGYLWSKKCQSSRLKLVKKTKTLLTLLKHSKITYVPVKTLPGCIVGQILESKVTSLDCIFCATVI